MKKKLLISAAVLAAFSACSGDYEFKPAKYRFQTLPQLKEAGPREPQPDATYIICAEFPAEYDYHTDPDYGSVEASLVFFEDGERVLTLPAGPGSQFSIDPDMHRCRGGHLYTDGVDATGTFVHCDGELLFRYEGREALRGFMLIDGKVHTLGQSRDGGGFSYRIDGEYVFGRKDGYILGDMSYPVPEGGALRTDEAAGGSSGVYFSYGIPHKTYEGTKWEYHLFRGGFDEIIDISSSTTEVFDVVVHGGSVYYTARRSDFSTNPVLEYGESSYSLGDYDYMYARPHICRIFFDGPDLYVKGWYETKGGEKLYVLWNRRGVDMTIPGTGAYDIWVSSGERFVLQKSEGILSIVRSWGGDSPSVDALGELSLPFNNCAAFSGGALSLALSAPDGKLVVYSAGETRSYDLYGYPTSIKIGL